MIKKLISTIVIILLSIIISVIYGIINDQVTYTISPEYYTKFKFEQFMIPYRNFSHVRIPVAITGFIACWWMGLIIGIIFAIFSLRFKGNVQMITVSIKAALIAILSTILFEIAGFLYGYFILINSTTYINSYGVRDFKNFLIVGTIHTAAYMGGLIGAIIGSIYILKVRVIPSQV